MMNRNNHHHGGGRRGCCCSIATGGTASWRTPILIGFLLLLTCRTEALFRPYNQQRRSGISSASCRWKKGQNTREQRRTFGIVVGVDTCCGSIRGGAIHEEAEEAEKEEEEAEKEEEEVTLERGGGVEEEDVYALEDDLKGEGEDEEEEPDDVEEYSDVDSANEEEDAAADLAQEASFDVDSSSEMADEEEEADTTTANVEDEVDDEEEEAGGVKEEEEEEDPLTKRRSEASQLRILGKDMHDSGDLLEASETFREAAELLHELEELIVQHDQRDDEDNGTTTTTTRATATRELLSDVVEEAATCRLHEALCQLKMKEYAKCVMACTDVLDDGVQIVPLDHDDYDEEEEENVNDGEELEEEDEDEEEAGGGGGVARKQHHRSAVVVRISPTGGGGGAASTTTTKSSQQRQISAPVRARAYHRRAKARLALNDDTGALDDARNAAFLGDRNAVALYGKLMRETGQQQHHHEQMMQQQHGSGIGHHDDGGGGLHHHPLFGNDLAKSGGGGGGGNDASTALLLESLLNGNSGAKGGSPLGALGDLTAALGTGGRSSLSGKSGGGSGNNGMDTIVKSLLSSLTKRIEDESTQESISQFLQGANVDSVTRYASMAGMTLSSEQATKIVSFANGITAKGIRKSVKATKRLIYAVTILRKVMKVLAKYRHIIVLLVILGWIKSSILRPMPVNKRRMAKLLAAEQAAGEVLKEATTAVFVV